MTNSSRVPNRLINEKSPYLLQHAYNPVDWFPWSQEAFDKAKEEDKPIFLSIGYSTCHWCHVMERESFEDEEVAAALNKNFISIKVDREERPDIDHLYMTFCQAMTGHGGWPLTVLLTPEKKPFFAGTYFPKSAKHGMPGLLDILGQVNTLWHKRRDDLLQISDELTQSLKREDSYNAEEQLSPEILDHAFNSYNQRFDSLYGGFGSAPKFPTPHNLTFLLRYGLHKKEKKAWEMVEKTLLQMYKGGIFDHIGFGFSRYSTDRQWLVPHFEKMLYDNALLIITYVETYQLTGKEIYKEVAEKVITYVLRDMTSPEGAFYSAEDADSEGVEGKFYLWSIEEVEAILGAAEAQKFCKIYDISHMGNFEGSNIPNLLQTKNPINAEEEELLASYREKLFKAREERVHPYKDDKVLTAWNGLMIAALAFSGRVLDKEQYVSAAEKALAFIRSHLKDNDGRLLARYREGEAAYAGYLDDYAFLIWALLELYQATFKAEYIEEALELTKVTLTDFWDKSGQGFFMTSERGEELLIRPKEVYDGAIPAGNSLMALNLLRLSALTNDLSYEEKAVVLLQAFFGTVKQYPTGYAALLQAMQFALEPTRQIIIVEPEENAKGQERQDGEVWYLEATQEFFKIINSRFLPTTVIHYLSGQQSEIRELFPFLKDYQATDKPTIYVCQNYSCQAPLTEPEDLIKILATE